MVGELAGRHLDRLDPNLNEHLERLLVERTRHEEQTRPTCVRSQFSMAGFLGARVASISTCVCPIRAARWYAACGADLEASRLGLKVWNFTASAFASAAASINL